MAVAAFIAGVALLAVAGVSVFGRERIVAHHRRSDRSTVQSPMAHLVTGTIQGFAGVVLIILAVR
jgi:UPF0716 family protein affecting phage T7 exclusion